MTSNATGRQVVGVGADGRALEWQTPQGEFVLGGLMVNYDAVRYLERGGHVRWNDEATKVWAHEVLGLPAAPSGSEFTGPIVTTAAPSTAANVGRSSSGTSMGGLSVSADGTAGLALNYFGVAVALVVTLPSIALGLAVLFAPEFYSDLYVLLLPAAVVYTVLWLVGTNLTKQYEVVVRNTIAAQTDESPRMPTQLNRAYGALLLCLLPYLIYLFVLALASVKWLVWAGLLVVEGSTRIPLFLPIGIGIIVLGSIWGVLVGMARLLFPPRPSPAGVGLERMQEPRMWALVDAVALDASTRPVESVVLTPDASIAVWEEGSLLKVLSGRGVRKMRIGIAAIQGMSARELRAILRHEFAHFANKDTRWSTFTHAMGQSLTTAFASTPGLGSLSRGFSWVGLVLALNPAWFVYLAFIRLFFRSTGGFSRLGEVVADWDAIAYAGGKTFADALSRVVVNDWALGRWLEVIVAGGALGSVGSTIFVGEGTNAVVSALTEEEFATTLDDLAAADAAGRETSDSHPELATRLTYALRFSNAGPPASEDQSALSLLDQPELLDRAASGLFLVSLARN